MLLSVNITEKSFGSNILYKNVAFEVQKDEKIGLIGRNGTGKSTLLNVISGDDKDFQGEIKIRKGAVVVVSRQEHHEFDSLTVLEYIQGDLPKYSELVHIIDTYPDTMGESQKKNSRI
jgi:ATPase subunit of ABC transporter with duplicated ATPase domains